uniref:Uncharacterized protein n=1 Tax=Steinernema glaseri TaxID=37863 RepID=A0A1I7XWT8_9BILA
MVQTSVKVARDCQTRDPTPSLLRLRVLEGALPQQKQAQRGYYNIVSATYVCLLQCTPYLEAKRTTTTYGGRQSHILKGRSAPRRWSGVAPPCHQCILLNPATSSQRASKSPPNSEEYTVVPTPPTRKVTKVTEITRFALFFIHGAIHDGLLE